MLEKIIPKIIGNDTNEAERDEWISAELKRIPSRSEEHTSELQSQR